MEEEHSPNVDEKSNTTMVGHILIRDKDTQEVIVNQRDTLLQQDILGNRHGR